jgi:hypothetical protein
MRISPSAHEAEQTNKNANNSESANRYSSNKSATHADTIELMTVSVQIKKSVAGLLPMRAAWHTEDGVA